MKVARLYESGKPLVVEEVPIPELNDDDVLVEVKGHLRGPFHEGYFTTGW